MQLFRKLQWPEWLMKFVDVLYQNNFCHIVLGGSCHQGFNISRGMRQGCPLSPLLFAVASDMLIRKLLRTFPHAVVKVMFHIGITRCSCPAVLVAS